MAWGDAESAQEHFTHVAPMPKSCFLAITSNGWRLCSIIIRAASTRKPSTAPHHASAALHDAHRDGVERGFLIFKEVAKADPSCSLSEDEPIAAFAAIVGANMLSQATGDAKCLTAVAEARWLAPRRRTVQPGIPIGMS
jgi:hypothetical protein